jgi:epoxyqueuosine reductase QueG
MATKKKSPARASVGVQEILSKLDVDLVGVARLRDLKSTKLEESTLKLLPSARSIVVLGMQIYPEFLDLTSPERIMGEASLYDLFNNHIDYLAGRLNEAAYDVANTSHTFGLSALPLPSRNVPTDRRTLQSIISYKHTAESAGLGQIGMSSLLVTHKYGPRVRLALCLTEASLKSTANNDPRACRYCNVCIAKCPAHALDWPKNGETYVINKFACQAYINASGGCSECMRLCPVASPRYA